jgi:uncharacterized membrane protein YbhN (UPF0104 family)
VAQLPSDKAPGSPWGKLALRAGLSALIVGMLCYKVNWASLGRVFDEMHLGLTLLAFIVIQIGQSFSSWRWKVIAEPLGFKASYGRFRSLFYIGTFFNLFLPTSVGGDAIRAWMLSGGKGKRLSAFSTVIADRVSGVTAMLVMACIASFTPMGELHWWIPLAPWGLLGGLLLIMALLPKLKQYNSKIALLSEGLGWEQGRWTTWWQGLGLSFIVQSMATLQVILLGIALALPVPWHAYLVVVPLVTLLTMFLPSLNGIGVREAGLFLLFQPYGISEAQGIALGMAWFALSIGIGLIGGCFYLFSPFSKVQVAESDDRSSDKQQDSMKLQAPLTVDSHPRSQTHNPAPQREREFEHKGTTHESFHCRADEGREGQRQAAA